MEISKAVQRGPSGINFDYGGQVSGKDKQMTADDDARVFLNGYLDVPADRLDAVRAALPEHIDLTRAEPGCMSFDVTESDDHPGRFMVAEIFENQAAFDAHQTRTRNSGWFAVTKGIPRDYSVTTGAPQKG